MKRFFIFLLLFMLTFGAFAVEAKPGDIIIVPVSVGASDSHVTLLMFDYDEDIFEFVSNECWGPNTQYTKYRMLMYDITQPIQEGEVGTITLRIKEDAPLGTYTIPVTYEAVNWDEEFTTVDVNVAPIEVTCPHASTWDYVAREADYENEGLIYVTCAKCGEVVRTEHIEKLELSGDMNGDGKVDVQDILLYVIKFIRGDK